MENDYSAYVLFFALTSLAVAYLIQAFSKNQKAQKAAQDFMLFFLWFVVGSMWVLLVFPF